MIRAEQKYHWKKCDLTLILKILSETNESYAKVGQNKKYVVT